MITLEVELDTIHSAVELATRAPSVHNSQPWQWWLGERSVHLYADPCRWLPVTEADERDLVLSCGAALHHLRVVLAASGVGTTVHRLPNPEEGDHLATVELHPGRAAETSFGLAAAIERRRTDRRGFSSWPLPEVFLQQLVGCAADQGAVLRVISEPRAHAVLVSAIREAHAVHEDVPRNGRELPVCRGRHPSSDGISALNRLQHTPVGVPTPRRFSTGEIEPATDETDGAVLVVLGTASDDRLSQLRAGEALSAVLLRATELGSATCPLTQPLEIDATYSLVRDQILKGTLSPQVIIRLGWAPAIPPPPSTPRRPITELIRRRRDA